MPSIMKTLAFSYGWNFRHSKNYEEITRFCERAWNFLWNGIQILVIRLIHSWEIALKSQIFNIHFLKNDQKRLRELIFGILRISNFWRYLNSGFFSHFHDSIYKAYLILRFENFTFSSYLNLQFLDS